MLTAVLIYVRFPIMHPALTTIGVLVLPDRRHLALILPSLMPINYSVELVTTEI